jgi:hypothetical protein
LKATVKRFRGGTLQDGTPGDREPTIQLAVTFRRCHPVSQPLQRRAGAINDADGGQPPCELLTAGHRAENVEDASVDCIAQRRLAVAEDLQVRVEPPAAPFANSISVTLNSPALPGEPPSP